MSAAAFFDLDRTLISGASMFPFAIEAWRAGLVNNRELGKWTMAALTFKLFGDTGERSDEVRSGLLGRIEGVSVSKLDEVARAVLPRLSDRVRPESRRLIKMHHEAERDTWIVSAAPQRIVEPLAETLGMTGAIATKGKVAEGHYTGELEGPFVYGSGKALALEKLASDRDYDLNKCYAYSDSISDLPMLETVGHPVAVNPDRELDEISHERGWPIVIFARKTKRAIALGGTASAGLAMAVGSYVLGRRHGRIVERARFRLLR
jgi:HAD superfamily hydrolase (TIGR01490 family)